MVIKMFLTNLQNVCQDILEQTARINVLTLHMETDVKKSVTARYTCAIKVLDALAWKRVLYLLDNRECVKIQSISKCILLLDISQLMHDVSFVFMVLR